MSKFGVVVIGGGTGFVGSALSRFLRNKGYGVCIVSRMPGPQRLSWTQLQERGLPPSTVAVVNVAGQNIMDGMRRWTPGFKQNVYSSRINTTNILAKAIQDSVNQPKPRAFVCMSGVGIYPPSDTREYDECYVPEDNDDYLSQLVVDWEHAGKLSPDLGVRHIIIRSGVVLGKNGGLIKQVYWPFFFGVGGPMGSGNQAFPWIHLHDVLRLILFSIKNNEVSGVLNGVAPQIITNKEFSRSFGKAMRRPAFFTVPEFVINMIFGDERAKLITQGQKVRPARVLEYKFQYAYPDIESACHECARWPFLKDTSIK